RSPRTNAAVHAGSAVVVKFDISDFYGSIGFNRVVAVFRGLGYSREAALWLARLTTSILPLSVNPPQPGAAVSLLRYQRRHLPQGAPTSPALANLAAFPLDVRLSGLARTFSARYTRYADDLTISGGGHLDRGLHVLLPLVRQIVKQERLRLNADKFRILRAHQRQIVTGVVVNTRPNVPRALFDELKAILTNCIRHGPASQNRTGATDFAAHLRGRIAYVQQLNPDRGRRLLELFDRIDWTDARCDAAAIDD
ncbi:MAG: RNA-directed DNA polymerase, partial [Planctomycetota bacterium]